MKALSLTQPWATLVALGEKRIETRSWRTDYRGPLAIHAAKGLPKEAKVLFLCVPFHELLTRHDHTISHMLMAPPPGVVPHDLPLGAVIATCTLLDCVRVTPTDEARRAYAEHAAPHEKALGDYAVGRYMWLLGDVQRLPEPIPARGSLGLWDWDAPK